METTVPVESNTFYMQIKNCEGLDLRDSRGRVHSLAYVLLGLMISLFRNRDGNMSSIHRSMVNTHLTLINSLKLDNTCVVSRSQLPVILKK